MRGKKGGAPVIVEVDTSIKGASLWLQTLARTNVLDCLNSEKLLKNLFYRCGGAPKCFLLRHGCGGERGHARMHYQREDPDVWTTFAPYYARVGATGTIVGDCEDFAAMWGAYMALHGEEGVHVCVTQPKGSTMAHAYCRVGGPRGRVVDPCVWYGMKAPRPTFYDDPTAETGSMPILVSDVEGLRDSQ